MKSDKRIVWLLADGRVFVTVPHEPIRGEYVRGDESVTVDEIGNGSTMQGVEQIEQLDALVAAGAATFTPSETEAEYLDRIAGAARIEGIALDGAGPARWASAVRQADISADEHLAIDRTFREAWTWVDPGISIDMAKAVEMHKDTLRALRAPLFVQNDIAIQDALVAGDKVALAPAVAKRDALRDVTDDPAIAAATTPDQLKAVIPGVLNVVAVAAK